VASAEECLAALPALTVSEVLERLVALRGRAAQNDEVKVPLATFHLRSGRDVTGWVLRRTEASPRGSGLLIQLAAREGQGVHAMYVDPQGIEAVTLLDVPTVAWLLTDGAVPPPEDPNAEPPPSRLALKRRAEEHSQTLTIARGSGLGLEVAWDGVPESTAALRSLARVVEELAEAALALVQDPEGRAAFGALQLLRVANGPRAAVAREGEVLRVMANLNAGALGRFARGDLQTELEKVL